MNPNDKKRTSVLMVDDDSDFLAIAKQCLNLQGGLVIETALSSKQATEMIEKKRPDVIVCDIQMPETNGFEFLKKLRDNGDNIPFIVFTMTGKKDLALEAFKLGADGFIGKHGDPSVVFSNLLKCIEKVLKNSMPKKVTTI